jgi:Flp pilus assembly protein TadG
MTVNNRLRKLARDEEGFSLVFVAMGFLAFLSVSMLAIDTGMLMTARNQAQNSADASALAGVTALVFDDWNDRSTSGPAVQNALTAARQNQVMGGTVTITPADVVFLNDATGTSDRVQSTVYRDNSHNNALPTLIAQYFGIKTVDVAATATAEATSANYATCTLPFTIPDRWIENSDGTGTPDGPWSPSSTFDLWYSKGSNQNGGVALPNPDVYVPGPASQGGTGYGLGDKGLLIVLKSNNQNKVSPSIYNPWDINGTTGANAYSSNISQCNPSQQLPNGSFLLPETGNMTGPTSQGVNALIAEDPAADWNDTLKCPVEGGNSNNAGPCLGPSNGVVPIPPGTTPRIGTIPLYDPTVYAQGQQSGKSQPQLQVVGYLGFFIEQVTGAGDVTGRICPILGGYNANLGPGTGSFAKAIRLVK